MRLEYHHAIHHPIPVVPPGAAACYLARPVGGWITALHTRPPAGPTRPAGADGPVSRLASACEPTVSTKTGPTPNRIWPVLIASPFSHQP
jgi:hypothetical protein